jgi:hypothetical protein
MTHTSHRAPTLLSLGPLLSLSSLPLLVSSLMLFDE